jgi:hypothetical protein
MKLRFNLLALILVTATLSFTVTAQTAPAQTEREWEKFSPAGSGFSVLMPGKVTEQDRPVEGGKGPLTNHIFYSDLGGDVFMVTYLQFPDPVTDAAAIKTMLDNGRDRGLEGSKGTLESETEITLDGYSGREWRMNLPKDLKVRAKAYWVSRTLYQVLVITDAVKTPQAEKATADRMTKFFNSFSLNKTAAN